MKIIIECKNITTRGPIIDDLTALNKLVKCLDRTLNDVELRVKKDGQESIITFVNVTVKAESTY